jgi:hypothetical protein
MAADVKIDGRTYRLRAGSPMPVGGSNFILQTFMGEEAKVTNYLYTETLPGSEEFRGQGGNKVSASFTRLLNTTGDSYSGKEQFNPEYVEER